MSPKFGHWLWFAIGSSLAVCGCDGEPQMRPEVAAELRQIQQRRASQPLEQPTDMEGIAKAGVPVYPGSFLSDKPDAIKVEQSANREVVAMKFYSPAEVKAVFDHVFRNIDEPSQVGNSEMMRVKGLTKNGHPIEVWIGPAADKSQSLVMAWVTEIKNTKSGAN
ncbi:MAG: hypothetical protein KF884_04595 [Fimbriimonadaceae bacterium]|nr:hypothetical protein [Fimbriimonadaceae bacterium]QYK59367.1 MAG: hypothetical protein KF884_04595 [Fimbriimonadaceae bacterium]